MHIPVFGATGGTGNQFVKQALAEGHTVTALVRDPVKLSLEDAGLTVMTGDVLDPVAVRPSLGPMQSSSPWATRPTTPNLWSPPGPATLYRPCRSKASAG